jgi:hypothetical protein
MRKHKHMLSACAGIAILCGASHAGPTPEALIYSFPFKTTVVDYRLTNNCIAFKLEGTGTSWYSIQFGANPASSILKALVLLDAFRAKRALMVELLQGLNLSCLAGATVFTVGEVFPYHPQ